MRDGREEGVLGIVMPTPQTSDVWPDDQLASVAAEVYQELQCVGLEEIAAAAKHCRKNVPLAAGVPALRHQMRRLALGLPETESKPRQADHAVTQ